MKRIKQIVKTLFAIGVSFTVLMGCSKKSNVSDDFLDSKSSDNTSLSTKDTDTQKNFFDSVVEAPETDFSFELTEDYEGVIIKKYKGYDVHMKVPSEIQGVPVVEIGEFAFRSTPVMTVVIPDSVKKIDNGVFSGCKFLENVKFPKSITSIPSSCFDGCESLTQYIIPESIKNIEESAFRGTGLASIYIPDDVTFISYDYNGEEIESKSVFVGCKKLTEVHLPSSMKSIPYGMFKDCESLTSIKLPDGITCIGAEAFSGCASLAELTIPSSVTRIRRNAFDKTALVVLNIPNSVTELECNFSECHALREIHLPDSLTEISDHLFTKGGYFSEEVLLEKVNIPASTQKIGEAAFFYCHKLNEVVIPDSLTEVEWLSGGLSMEYDAESIAFKGCSNLSLATQKRIKELGYPGKF